MVNLRNSLGLAIVGGTVFCASSLAVAADLPEHDPLRIVIVSDGVNPHGLTDGELTQPGELAAAINNPASGINVESVVEVDSQCVDEALDALAAPGETNVVIYFSHLAALRCDGTPDEPSLDAAFESHLQAGGGIVVFHHGIYEADGKGAVLDLLGGRASSIAWDTAVGQDVIAVDTEHFITQQGVEYSGMQMFNGLGVSEGEYPFFNNTPDELYPATELLTQGGETRTLLFATADGAGTPRVLGYDLHRSDWSGHVVFYQPGEYQPQAIDDLEGNNFQILANSIYYVATTQEEGGMTSGGMDTGEPDDSGGPTDGSGGGDAMQDSGGDGGTVGGGTSGPTSSPTSDGGADGGGGGGDEGCGCTTGSNPAWWPGLLVMLGFVRRRRSQLTA